MSNVQWGEKTSNAQRPTSNVQRGQIGCIGNGCVNRLADVLFPLTLALSLGERGEHLTVGGRD
jgi:hypothetical protein